jgi:hypothetical protein
MPEEKERPRPHGDPLRDELDSPNQSREDNPAQANSDAAPDAVGSGHEESDRDSGRGSDANGVPAFDEASGRQRREQYDNGADLVSRID